MRIDDGDRVPCDANIAEGPVEQGAVCRRRIEHPVRRISGRRRAEVRLPARTRPRRNQPRRGSDGAADRDERQRVREVAMELGVEKRIGAAADERIDVRQQRAVAAPTSACVSGSTAQYFMAVRSRKAAR